MKLEIPEKRLLEIGFRILDSMYGELTIMKGKHRDIVFVDKNNDARFVYVKPELLNQTYLTGLDKDREFFISIFPVEYRDYVMVIKNWMETRYNRKVGAFSTARNLNPYT